MDSLRNLSTSLPRTAPTSASPHELLASFKAAALSVTNLYKTAATEQARHKAAGYQEALGDLLTLLDRENLGLGVDGEGWRVRQWATERFNGDGYGQSDDEDEREEPQPQQPQSRHESPEMQRKQEHQEAAAETPAPQQEVKVEAVPTLQHSQPPDMFTFRSSLPYPSGNHDRDTDMDAGNLGSDPTNTAVSATQQHPAVNFLPRQRSSRHGHRHASGGNRTNSTNATNLGTGAGSKRKVPDFFDLSGFGGFGGGFGGNSGGKEFDRSGGGKRGRHA